MEFKKVSFQFTEIFSATLSVFTISVLFFLSGCATPPWEKYKISSKPDISCKTGIEGGVDLWSWSCLNGEHIVVWRNSSAYFGRGTAHQEIAACGAKTSIEQGDRLTFWRYPECKRQAPAWGVKEE